MKSRLILVGGGARSGKSALALNLARGLGPRRLFLATAQPGDDEMRERIHRHKRERGEEFQTIEEPLALADVLSAQTDHDVVLIDCLTLWLSNLLLGGQDVSAIERRVEELTEILGRGPAHAIVVSNEVGLGLVPETPLGRTFRDLAGRAHQLLAARADEVYFGALGVMLRLKPGPVVPASEVLR